VRKAVRASARGSVVLGRAGMKEAGGGGGAIAIAAALVAYAATR